MTSLGSGTGDLRDLAEGANYLFLSYLVSFIAFIVEIAALAAAGFTGITAAIRGAPPPGIARSVVTEVLAGIVAALVLSLVAVLLSLKGFYHLQLYDSLKYGIGYTGVKIGVAAVVLILLGALAALASHGGSLIGVWTGASLLIIGFIIALVSLVFIAVALWRLGDEEGGGLVRLGVVLWVLGIILAITRVGGLLAFIGSLLIMIGARDIRNKALARLRYAEAPMSPSGMSANR